MATVVNFIDVTLRGAAARTVNLASAQILLTPSAPAFHVSADGVITPESITFTATRIDVDADLAFNCTGAELASSTATTATLFGADMVGSSATVIASATVNGQLYTGPCTISKFKDGKDATGAELTAGDLKAILEGQITTDELTAALTSRIGLIDGGADVAGSVAARVKAETDARIAAISQASTDNRTYVQQYTYSQQTINNSFSAFGVSIQAAYQGYADGAAGGALAAAKSFAQTYAYSRADADSALTATANTLRSEFATLNQGTGATVAWVQSYAYSRAEADSAIASSTQQLSTTVADHTTTIETQSQSINGLSGQYSVKVDNNNYVSGFGLASTPINGVPTSSFIVLADRFAVALPGQPAKYPFAIGKVAGQTTITFNGNIIADGSFTFRDANGKVLLSVGVPLDPSLAAPGTLNSDLGPAISAAARTAFTAAIGCSWEFKGSMEGWTFLNAFYATHADSFDFTAQNSDPILFSPTLSFSGAQFDKVRMKVKRANGSGWEGKLFWLNANHADVNAYTLSIPDTTVNGSYVILEWDLTKAANYADWASGTITRLRIDLGAASGDAFEVDWICVGKYAPAPSLEAVAAAGMTSTWGGTTGAGKPADNATVGAPSGSYVGGTEAGLVASRALNGDSAFNAVNDPTLGLASRMRSNTANVLAAGGGLVAGSLTYDTNGNRTGGFGMAFNQRGIVGFNSGGIPTITMDAATGEIAARGDISGSTGTFGSVRIGVSLALKAGAFNADPGIFMGLIDGIPKFSIVAANGAKLIYDPTLANPLSLVNVATATDYVYSVTSNTGQQSPIFYLPRRNEQFAGTYISSSNAPNVTSRTWRVTSNGTASARLVVSTDGTQASLYVNANGLANEDGYDFYVYCDFVAGGSPHTGGATATCIFS